MRPSTVAPVYKSIIRGISDLIEELNALGRFGPIEYHNFESRGDEDKLPRSTLIGPDGFSFNPNEGRWIIRLALAISSYRDFNLHEEIEMIDEIERRWGEGEKVALRDMETGEILSELIIVACEILPMGQSELRNYRTIGIELHRTEIIRQAE